MTVNHKLEVEAYVRLSETLQDLDDIRLMFEQARAPIPDVLLRLSRSSNGHQGGTPDSPVIEAEPARPENVDPDWIWISVKDATIGTLALAIALASRDKPMTARDIHAKVNEFDSEVPLGTIQNVGTRAEANGLIVRNPAGHWTVVNPSRVGMLDSDFIWGPASTFQMQEVAAYRRFFIVNFLKKNPVGMQQSQILSYLQSLELINKEVPVNKSLVKADMEAMEGTKVRRRGNSKKWEAIPQ